MGFSVGRAAYLLWLSALALGAIALAGSLAETAHANACSQFGATKAQMLSNQQATRSIGCLLDRARHRHGLNHLNTNRRLQRAAERHTNYMKRHHCFSHQCPGERSLLARLQRVNYIVGGLIRWSCGENIAWGSDDRGTPKSIVKAWMHSPAHRANILNPLFRHVGVGFTRGYSGWPGLGRWDLHDRLRDAGAVAPSLASHSRARPNL